MRTNPSFTGIQVLASGCEVHVLESSVDSAIDAYFWDFKGHKDNVMTSFFQFNCKINIVKKRTAQVGHSSCKEDESHY